VILALLLALGDTDPAAVYNGRAGRLDVHPPRLEAAITVDGSSTSRPGRRPPS
jgi:hypothetical protein